MDKIGGMLEEVNESCNTINKEYAKNINKLLKKIAEGEKLDYEILKEKYLKSSTTKIVESIGQAEPVGLTEENEMVVYDNTDELSEIIFDKIIINDNNYYYENKENGKIYDSSSNIVGVFKNKNFILT
jgi:hypothetical protein